MILLYSGYSHDLNHGQCWFGTAKLVSNMEVYEYIRNHMLDININIIGGIFEC